MVLIYPVLQIVHNSFSWSSILFYLAVSLMASHYGNSDPTRLILFWVILLSPSSKRPDVSSECSRQSSLRRDSSAGVSALGGIARHLFCFWASPLSAARSHSFLPSICFLGEPARRGLASSSGQVVVLLPPVKGLENNSPIIASAQETFRRSLSRKVGHDMQIWTERVPKRHPSMWTSGIWLVCSASEWERC